MPAASSLADGLVAFGEQGSVSTRVEEKLQRYLALLSKWNRVYNLTAITETEQMITRHVLDSLAIAAPLDLLLKCKPGARILDTGSGAGLPGIPLAIARPAWQLTLLDSNSKKTAFIAQVAAEIGLSNVTIVTARAESFVATPFDIIVSRAFASLREFVNKTRTLLGPAGSWAAMKGGVPHGELRELPSDVECRDILRLQVPGLDAERHLLLLKVKTE